MNKENKIEKEIDILPDDYIDSIPTMTYFDVFDKNILGDDDKEVLKDILYHYLKRTFDIKYDVLEYLVNNEFLTLEYKAFTSNINYLFYINSIIPLSSKYNNYISYINKDFVIYIGQVDHG